MAKSFKSLKDPKLHLLDKLPFGKYKDCRIVDIMPDSWEYLMWLSKNTQIAFGQDVIDEISKHFKGYEDARHEEEEIKPWQQDNIDLWNPDEDDIPF